jgi:hypothetical protein
MLPLPVLGSIDAIAPHSTLPEAQVPFTIIQTSDESAVNAPADVAPENPDDVGRFATFVAVPAEGSIRSSWPLRVPYRYPPCTTSPLYAFASDVVNTDVTAPVDNDIRRTLYTLYEQYCDQYK